MRFTVSAVAAALTLSGLVLAPTVEAQDCVGANYVRPAGMAPGEKLTKKQKDSIEAVLSSRIVGNGEVLVVATASPTRVQQRLQELFEQCQLAPITWNTPGQIRASLPREQGMFDQFEITVTARVQTGTDGTRVRMFADETTISSSNGGRTVRRVTMNNMGRSRATILSLTGIAHAIALDTLLTRTAAPVRAATPAASPAVATPASGPSAAPASGESFVGNAMTKMYFLKGCQAASSIQPENLVVFSTKQEAVAAGYARSGAPGC